MLRFIMAIFSAVLFISLVSCDRKEDPVVPPSFVENTSLKSKLQGNWERLTDESFYNFLNFQGNTLTWSDSMAGPEGIQSVKGKCPVKYSFRDGINHYNPRNSGSYWFSDVNENNILWLLQDQADATIVTNYRITEGVITKEDSYSTTESLNQYIGASYVVFKDNETKVEFCIPYGFGNYSCFSYQRK